MINKSIFHKAPLVENRFAPLPLTAVRPKGWLKDQMQLAAEGLTGHLSDFWPDVGKNCAWLGGNGDGWERAPYYLDGLLPLAYILKDEKLIAKANAYIEWALQSQREDGFFGPEDNADWWPRMVMLKAFMQYYTATADTRVPQFMLKYCAYQLRNLDGRPLREWAVVRACDNIHAVLWLYNLTGKKWLLSLAEKLAAQSLDWTGHFHTFAHTRPIKHLYPWTQLRLNLKGERALTGHDRPYLHAQYHLSHVVNVAMGLKYPGVMYALKGGKKHASGFQTGYEKLMKHHGVAHGMFTGDEHLSGSSPVQGTELCAVAEMMYTLEVLLGITGEPELADLLEKLAFGALTATISPDMKTHQYDQQVNQVRVSDQERPWYNNGSDANVFGVEPHFGCCTANMHQALPKFVSSLWYASRDGGLAIMSYAPATVRARAGGAPVQIDVDSEYPYRERAKLQLKMKKPAQFALHMRIPGWAEGARITLPDGEILSVSPGDYARIDRMWQNGDQVHIHLPMAPRVSTWYHQSVAVELGPLLMAFRPEENWSVIRDMPYAPDYGIETGESWNYALALGENYPMRVVSTQTSDAKGRARADVAVMATAAQVPGWGMQGASAAPPPILPDVERESLCEIALTPYGRTSLRIAQFPRARVRE